jgi:hypothetical protein
MDRAAAISPALGLKRRMNVMLQTSACRKHVKSGGQSAQMMTCRGFGRETAAFFFDDLPDAVRMWFL